MKNLIGVIILAVVCIGLAVALFTTKKQATDEKHKDSETILYHSNQWEKTRADLGEHKQVIQNLEKDIAVRKEQFADLTNKYTEVSTTLSKTETELKETLDEVTKREAKIADLEAQNQQLDQKAIGLSTALTNLTVQIADTQRKLSAAEGDKEFLGKELARLMGEKAELERQFNDLTVLKAQVAKLKEELSIARRLEWIRKGLYGVSEQKGAQQLITHSPTANAADAKSNHFDLNVEVNADGSVRVIPPLTGTNAPAGTNAPPK